MHAEKSTVVALVSLGCPKNLIDSEAMLGALATAGCVVSLDMADADVVVINTCGFLDAARAESMEVVAEALALKAAGTVRRIVVAGCLAQRDGEAIRAAAPGVDAIVGVNNRDDLIKAVLGEAPVTLTETYAQAVRAAGFPVVADDTGRLRLTPAHTAYLRISEGCSQGCSFCTIPAIRGPFRSKPFERVLAEARELAADGAVELNVIGQDTTGYGQDLPDGTDLAALLRALDGLEGPRWIRVMYAYPTGVTDAVIEAMASCRKVVPYLDVPLQHIADGVLQRMGRRTTRAATEALLAKLRERIEGIAIRTTFIVGFPGETEAQFEELLDFVRAFRFDAMGVFAYSSEAGTPAARLDGAVPAEVADRRVETLMLAQQAIAFEAGDARAGETLEVLVDGIDPDGRCLGRHAGQAPDVDSVCYLTDPLEAGRIVPARVVGREGYDLIVRPAGGGRATGRRRK
ncbi:MAG: 30S ribosomal protein S12 methylthiotransferase RimO [Planctomycetes bacterium]|nr:30S ribosomal protein S12 methylthiotransferase RimO [Planctomycetota bacterium]